MIRRFSALLLALFVVGCTDTGSDPDPNAHVGTYTLVSLNGATPPVNVGFVENFAVTVLSGSATLNADQTASFQLRLRLTQGSLTVEETESDVGTYTRDGTAILVVWSDGSTDTLSFDEDDRELTTTFDGMVAVFRR